MRAPVPLCDRLCLTPREIAQATGVNLDIVRAAIKDGSLGPVHAVSSVRSLVLRDNVVAWLAQTPIKGAEQ